MFRRIGNNFTIKVILYLYKYNPIDYIYYGRKC